MLLHGFIVVLGATVIKLIAFILTSIPAWRKTLHAGKNDRYFDFEQLELCIYIDKT